ncbi:macrolide 2'-phosphotransferase [Sinomonas sp. ASV486]|uniref:macrolide 2'-phosphotransferase n=1 Tax=Sinomonas sp. ASV486 TaxID=3051170 RepID=UPI0027DCB417|nr:macrolide 2'-phosphotransferase [Sinomonas sp. ASV486]MDQ4491036.1 macrolide 2'-phosphotransferase [Sinomonas sp. ASV486]
MKRTPFELAAIATAAVPGLKPTAAAASPDDATDFDAALLETADGRRWRIRCPRGTEASARLETEMTVLRAFDPSVRAELPFQMPAVAGTVRMDGLTTCVYTNLTGTVRGLDELTAGTARLAREVGATLAAIHGLPQSLVDGADLPSYTANGFRQRRLNELDQAATTGKIPPVLLRRWEQAMEDVTLWRFNPTVVHGDLHEDNLLVDEERVTAVTGWTDLRIGDPADDFAWLVASNEPKFIESVLAAYHSSRKEPVDPQLARRAALAAEFALAQYLVKALALGDDGAVADARHMLAELAADIEASEAAEAEAAAAGPILEDEDPDGAPAEAVPVDAVSVSSPAGGTPALTGAAAEDDDADGQTETDTTALPVVSVSNRLPEA